MQVARMKRKSSSLVSAHLPPYSTVVLTSLQGAWDYLFLPKWNYPLQASSAWWSCPHHNNHAEVKKMALDVGKGQVFKQEANWWSPPPPLLYNGQIFSFQGHPRLWWQDTVPTGSLQLLLTQPRQQKLQQQQLFRKVVWWRESFGDNRAKPTSWARNQGRRTSI